jgi:hypothetical protein
MQRPHGCLAAAVASCGSGHAERLCGAVVVTCSDSRRLSTKVNSAEFARRRCQLGRTQGLGQQKVKDPTPRSRDRSARFE